MNQNQNQNQDDQDDDLVDMEVQLPTHVLAGMGLTRAQVSAFPPLEIYSDALAFSIAFFCCAQLGGPAGTPIQFMHRFALDEETMAGFVVGQIGVYLAQNRIMPDAAAIVILPGAILEAIRGLAAGTPHHVNRRAALTARGVITTTGILPVNERNLLL